MLSNLLSDFSSDFESEIPHGSDNSVPQPALASPEKAVRFVTGKDTESLRRLAMALARGCMFGDDVLERSTPTGRGNNMLPSLDPTKMATIKEL